MLPRSGQLHGGATNGHVRTGEIDPVPDYRRGSGIHEVLPGQVSKKKEAKAVEAEGQQQLQPKAEGLVTGTPAEESEDEVIEAMWQNLSKDSSRHNAEDSQDEEIIEETSEQQQPREKAATYDPDPQLPGSPSRTKASLARVLNDARSMGKEAK